MASGFVPMSAVWIDLFQYGVALFDAFVYHGLIMATGTTMYMTSPVFWPPLMMSLVGWLSSHIVVGSFNRIQRSSKIILKYLFICVPVEEARTSTSIE